MSSNQDQLQIAQTENDVDTATAKDIFALTGGVAEELKLHREAILALAVLITGNSVGSMDRVKAQRKAMELQTLNQGIEAIVERGRQLKKAFGLR